MCKGRRQNSQAATTIFSSQLQPTVMNFDASPLNGVDYTTQTDANILFLNVTSLCAISKIIVQFTTPGGELAQW